MRLLSACLRRIGALVVQGWRGEQVATLARVVVLVASATLTITAVGPAEPQGSAWDAEDFPNVLLVKQDRDRKSTRLNSSHDQISYAVFCLKKKKIERDHACTPHASSS